MGGFLFWLAVVFCVIALVLLFFPIRFKIEFEAGESGGRALFFFWGKRLWTGEKKWGKKDSEDVAKDEGAEPEFVATAPVRPAEKMSAPAEKFAAEELNAGTKICSRRKACGCGCEAFACTGCTCGAE